MKMLLLSILLFLHYWTYAIYGQETNSEILKRTVITEYNNSKATVTDSVTIKINNRDGDDMAFVYIPYSKGDKVSIEEAYITDTLGNIIRKLNKKDVIDHNYISNSSLYEDHFIKRFELKHNQYPYIVRYTTKINYDKQFIISAIELTNNQTNIAEYNNIVRTDLNETILIKQKNIEAPTITETSKNKEYKWTFSFKPNKREIFGSINNSTEPILYVVPENFIYGVSGSFKNWEAVGNWIYRLNAGRDILPDSEKNKIDNLLKDCSTNYDKIKTLFYYLQDYNRYINVSLKVGGLQTYPAEYVTRNHYGDCKALSNYYKAMLKHAGIESFYTIINSDDRIEDIDPNFAIQAFNHVIVTIPQEKDTLFVECTSKTLPLGYIHSSIQGRKALIVTENNSHLIDIPATKPEDIVCESHIEATINGDNLVHLKGHIIKKGDDFEAINSISKTESKTDLDKYIRNKVLPKNIDQLAYNIENYSRDSIINQINFSGTTHSLVKCFGNNISMKPFPIKTPALETPENRKRDIQIDYPLSEVQTYKYVIPEKSISKIPENILVTNKFGDFSIVFEKSEDTFQIKKSFTLKSGRYTLDEYKSFFDFIQTVRNIESKNYYIETL